MLNANNSTTDVQHTLKIFLPYREVSFIYLMAHFFLDILKFSYMV